MLYFAMIDGERRGPYRLDELAEAGVGPDTFVWCRGMEDWQKADEVADICRHFRQTIFNRMHPSVSKKADEGASGNADEQQLTAADSEALGRVPLSFRRIVEKSGETPQFNDAGDNAEVKQPAPTLFISIFLTLFCFPVTGLVAIYYSWGARKAWEEIKRSREKQDSKLYTESERQALCRRLADCDRQARMWTGITFFLGIIFYAMLGNKFT